MRWAFGLQNEAFASRRTRSSGREPGTDDCTCLVEFQSFAARYSCDQSSSTTFGSLSYTRRTSDTMPDPVSVGIAVGVATGAAAIAQSRLQAARDAKAAERDASTISGILKEMSLTTSRVRQGTSAAYGRLASGSTPRRPSLTRRPSAKRVPIFSYGEVAGLSVRLPADGKTCGPKGLLVTDALRGQWAHQCGVQAGARLVSIDGTRLEGLEAAEIRLAASRASRPLWLDLQTGGHAPTGDALSGAHLML